MSSEIERYNYAKEMATKLQTDLQAASGGIENTDSAVLTISETDKKEWADRTHNYIASNIRPEAIDIIEERVRTMVIPKINENPPAAEPTLSSSAKASAIRSLEYAERNLTYVRGSVGAVPSMLEKTTRISTDIANLRTAVVEDPPLERHSRTHRNVRHGEPVRVGSRRGLTPRQRRRL